MIATEEQVATQVEATPEEEVIEGIEAIPAVAETNSDVVSTEDALPVPDPAVPIL